MALACAALLWTAARPSAQAPRSIQFVFTSDAHYGLTRPTFRGAVGVDASQVNGALVAAVNTLPATAFPDDGGVGAAAPAGAFDFLAQGGDIANRMELDNGRQIQTAAASFAQFTHDYIDSLTLRSPAGGRTPVFIVPGNHDASNALGFHRVMTPLVDPTAMIEIYNRMMAPASPRTAATFDYRRDRVEYARDIGGVHFVFVGIWPDSKARAWMERDLATVKASTPVVIVAHDEVAVEAKHFVNPNGRHDVNATDQFENLLADTFAGGEAIEHASVVEQRAFEAFLRRHPNVTAYFHGNSNWNQFYDYVGPDHSVALHVFRVDSPMKGQFSMADETRLSFQVATIDMTARLMTVREVLWNAHRAPAPVVWGASTTVALSPRPAR